MAQGMLVAGSQRQSRRADSASALSTGAVGCGGLRLSVGGWGLSDDKQKSERRVAIMGGPVAMRIPRTRCPPVCAASCRFRRLLHFGRMIAFDLPSHATMPGPTERRAACSFALHASVPELPMRSSCCRCCSQQSQKRPPRPNPARPPSLVPYIRNPPPTALHTVSLIYFFPLIPQSNQSSIAPFLSARTPLITRCDQLSDTPHFTSGIA